MALALLAAQVPQGCHAVPASGSANGFVCTYDVPTTSSGVHVPWVIVLLLFVLWITLSFLASRDMERRGQSGVVWFVVVFFAGIIGLVLWLVMRTNYEVQPERPDPPRSPYVRDVPLAGSPWSSQGTTDQW
jgi:RsiW-degrading membrane proteinase PrsW (M82 family)